MARSEQAQRITSISNVAPIIGSQLSHIADVFGQMVAAESQGFYSEAIADLDVIVARLAAHRDSLAKMPAKAAPVTHCTCGKGHMTMIGHTPGCPFVAQD
jgi:hypothetical protein